MHAFIPLPAAAGFKALSVKSKLHQHRDLTLTYNMR